MLSKLKSALRALLRKSKLEQELDEELRFHIEQQTELNIRLGMSPEEARRAAYKAFGGVEQAKELSRDVRGVRWLEEIWQDLRYGGRMLIKHPAFSLTATLTLALGIGANSAIFSVLDAVLLRTLPVQRPEQLAILRHTNSDRSGAEERFAYPTYRRFRDSSPTVSGVIASAGILLLNISFNRPGEQVEIEHAGVSLVSGNYFSVLGVSSALGRALSADDDISRGGHPVAVLSYRYWQRRFGLDPTVVGKTFTLNQRSFTVIGVAAEGFFGESIEGTPDLWIPLSMRAQVIPGDQFLDHPSANWLHVIARLQPDIAIEQATAQLNIAYQQILRENDSNSLSPEQRQRFAARRIELLPGAKGLADARRHLSLPLSIVMGIAGFVLLIACANLANLLLARAITRRKEIAIRLAIGAGRWRLIRQLLTESMMLSIIGGGLGLCFAYWAAGGISALLDWAPEFPMAIKFSLDLRLLAFTAAVSLLSSLLFAITPALRATRLNVNSQLKSGASFGSSARRWDIGKLLLTGQVAISIVLLIGAGLFGRSLQKLQKVELGFKSENLLLLKYDPATTGYKEQQLASLYRRLLEGIRSLPGVRSASLSAESLISGGMEEQRISIPGSATPLRERMTTYSDLVASSYFETVGMSLVTGRGFLPQDTENAPRVAIINETLARDIFGQKSALGQRVEAGDGENRQLLDIIGVVRDAKYVDLQESPRRILYRPISQASGQYERIRELQIRTDGPPPSMASAIQREIGLVDQRLSAAILDVRTMVNQIDMTLVQERLTAKLSGLFGLVALVLVVLGLYGVLTFSVSQRVSEIGIRMALGAQSRDTLKLVIGQGLKPILIGIIIGLAASFALSRIIASLLFGVTVTDPLTFATAPFLLIVVALLACYIPARKATKIDPLAALKHE